MRNVSNPTVTNKKSRNAGSHEDGEPSQQHAAPTTVMINNRIRHGCSSTDELEDQEHWKTIGSIF